MCNLRPVTLLDGLYRHRDDLLRRDDVGVTFIRPALGRSSHVDWNAIDGARQIGGRPGYVQLLRA